MSYPGLTFALMVGVAIGTAIYYYFKSETPNQNYHYRAPNDCNYYAPPECPDTRRSTKRRRNSNTSQKCSICLDISGDTKRVSCGHWFHDHCITSWLNLNRSCPNCRTVL